MTRYSKHFPHYLPLLGIFVASIYGFRIFSYDRNFQAAVAIASAVSYASWGIIHHIIHKDIRLSIFIEYLVISIIGLIVILSVIFRA